MLDDLYVFLSLMILPVMRQIPKNCPIKFDYSGLKATYSMSHPPRTKSVIG